MSRSKQLRIIEWIDMENYTGGLGPITIVFHCPICKKTYTLDVDLRTVIDDLETRGIAEIYTFHPGGETPHIVSFHIDKYGFPRGHYIMKVNIKGMYVESLVRSPREVITDFIANFRKKYGDSGYIITSNKSAESIEDMINTKIEENKDYTEIIGDILSTIYREVNIEKQEKHVVVSGDQIADEKMVKDLTILILSKLAEKDPSSTYIITTKQHEVVVSKLDK